jgi:hypothetical protein
MIPKMAKVLTATLFLSLCISASPQQAPQNGPAGANGPAEARALGYLHTIFGAEREYKKKHGAYAKSMALLVGNGSFTRRMNTTDRGDYTVHFASNGENFSVGMVPKTFDADHRAFFINDTGTVRFETDKPAGPQSEVLK